VNPQALQVLAALCSLVQKLSGWPVGTVLGILLLALIGPWVVVLLTSRAQEKRFEAVQAMYESNVTLIKSFEKLANVQAELISLNTAKWTEVGDKVDTNQYCPLLRIKKERMEDIRG